MLFVSRIIKYFILIILQIANEFRKQYNEARETNSKILNIKVVDEPIPQVTTAPESDAPDLSKLKISEKKPEGEKA